MRCDFYLGPNWLGLSIVDYAVRQINPIRTAAPTGVVCNVWCLPPPLHPGMAFSPDGTRAYAMGLALVP